MMNDKERRVFEIACEFAKETEHMQVLHLRRQTLRTEDAVEAIKADSEYQSQCGLLLHKECALVEAVRELRNSQLKDELQNRLKIRGMLAEERLAQWFGENPAELTDMNAAIAHAREHGVWLEESESDVAGIAVCCGYDRDDGYYLNVLPDESAAIAWAGANGFEIVPDPTSELAKRSAERKAEHEEFDDE